MMVIVTLELKDGANLKWVNYSYRLKNQAAREQGEWRSMAKFEKTQWNASWMSSIALLYFKLKAGQLMAMVAACRCFRK